MVMFVMNYMLFCELVLIMFIEMVNIWKYLSPWCQVDDKKPWKSKS